MWLLKLKFSRALKARGKERRASTRSMPDSAARLRGKENEEGRAAEGRAAKRASTRKGIRQGKKAAAEEERTRHVPFPYDAPPGPYNPGPRSAPVHPAHKPRSDWDVSLCRPHQKPSPPPTARSLQPPPPPPAHLHLANQSGGPHYSNLFTGKPRARDEDQWSDIASDVGFRASGQRRAKSRHGASSKASSRHDASSNSSRKGATPTPVELYFSQERQRQAKAPAGDSVERRQREARDAMPPPLPQRPRYSSRDYSVEASLPSPPSTLSRRHSPTPLSPSRSPECHKLTIRSLRKELDEERKARLRAEAEAARLRDKADRYREQREAARAREAEAEESTRRHYSAKLEEIAVRFAAAVAQQEEQMGEIRRLREEKRELRAQLEDVKARYVDDQWKAQFHMAQQSYLHSPAHSQHGHGRPLPNLHGHSHSYQPPRRSATTDAASKLGGVMGSAGSDPSLPSQDSSSPVSHFTTTSGAGDGLISQSFLRGPPPPLPTATTPATTHRTSPFDTSSPYPPPPPPTKQTTASSLNQDLDMEDDEDKVRDFTSHTQDQATPLDSSELSALSSIGKMRAGDSDASLVSERIRTSLLIHTPKPSPSVSEARVDTMDSSASAKTLREEAKSSSPGLPVSHSSSGVSSDPHRKGELAVEAGAESLESLASLDVFCSPIHSSPLIRRSISDPQVAAAKILGGCRSPFPLPASLSDGELAAIPLAAGQEAAEETGSPAAMCQPLAEGREPDVEELEASLELEERDGRESFAALASASGPSPLRVVQLAASPTPRRPASKAAQRGRRILEQEMREALVASPPSDSSSSESEEEGALTQREWDRQLKANPQGRIRYLPPPTKPSILTKRLFTRFGRAERSALDKFAFLEADGAGSSSPSSEPGDSSADSSLLLSDLPRLSPHSSHSDLSLTNLA